MRTLGAALACVLVSSQSVIASDTLSLAALLTHGLADGAQIVIYGIGKADVEETGQGTYAATFVESRDRPEGPAVLSYSFREVANCQVEANMQLQGPGAANPSTKSLYDFDLLTSVVEAEGQGAEVAKVFGLTVVRVGFEAAAVAPSEYQRLAGYLFTSISVEAYRAAATRLEQIC